MSIPMGNQQPINLFIDLTYSLKSIDTAVGLFDVIQKVFLNSNQENLELFAEGEGFGLLYFDIEKGISSRYETELPMKMRVTMPGQIIMLMEMQTKTIVTTTTDN